MEGFSQQICWDLFLKNCFGGWVETAWLAGAERGSWEAAVAAKGRMVAYWTRMVATEREGNRWTGEVFLGRINGIG